MSETEGETFVPDMDAIAAASLDVVAAEESVRAAEERAGITGDALADANDDVTVAETKVDDYTDDDTKLPWQIASAQRELAKKTRAQARAQRRHDETQHELTKAQQVLADAHAALEVARSTPASAGEDVDEDGVQLLVWSVPLTVAPPELVVWVESTLQEYLTSTAGPFKGAKWCRSWHTHPDAVHRLAAIYDQWTLMRLGGKLAPSLHAFIREVLDYHMPYLVSRESGIFQRCDVDGHDPHTRIDAG